MLSYQHGFHAGNHADVVKHLVLLGLLRKLQAKDKPFTCIDSHGGAGVYDLCSRQASLNAEHDSGISLLWQQSLQDPLLADYQRQVGAFNDHRLRVYPGSPLLIQANLRADDRLQVIELHPAEIEYLRHHLGEDRRVGVHHRDAFEGLLALCPPEPRRGLALIDPSYENSSDYRRVVDTLVRLHRRWPVGIVAVWYPKLGLRRDRSAWLCRAVARAGLPNCLNIELDAAAQTEDFGMHGSGMLVVNAPWQFDRMLEPALQELRGFMSKEAAWRITWLTSESAGT